MSGFAEYRPDGALPPVDVTVRQAVADDLDDLGRIQVAAGRGGRPEHWARAIGDDSRCVVVAEVDVDGRPVVAGWAQTSRFDDPQGAVPAGHYLGGVTVDPPWRRRGIAVELTEARMRWIGARADEAFYVVNARNRASIDLHRRWGFVEVARGPGFGEITFEGGLGFLMQAPLGP